MVDGGAGAGGLRYEALRRLRVVRETRVRPRLAHVPSTLLDTRAPERPAADEVAGSVLAATRLRHRCGPHVSLLDDRLVAAGRVDMIAVARTGVTVVDVRRWPRMRVEVARAAGFLPAPGERLVVQGQDRTRVVAELERQRAAVRALLDTAPWGATVPVRAVLCVVDTDLPLLSTPAVRGVPLVATCQLSRRLNRVGPLSDTERARVLALLDGACPRA